MLHPAASRSPRASPGMPCQQAIPMGLLELPATKPLCHSREGGNPFGGGHNMRTMDSRLRGNDT